VSERVERGDVSKVFFPAVVRLSSIIPVVYIGSMYFTGPKKFLKGAPGNAYSEILCHV
jgi:hypothetical protein